MDGMEIVWKLIGILSLINLLRMLFFTDYTRWDDKPAPIKEPKVNLEIRPLLKCYYLLQLDPHSKIGITDIHNAYTQQVFEIAKLKKSGFIPMHDLNEIESAKEVLMDYHQYAAYRN
jgi:hypothetical protein